MALKCSDAALQDGLLAVCALPGQVLQHSSGTCLVLGQHKWSILVWPALTTDPSLGGNLHVWLDARGSAQWLHVWSVRSLFSFASTSVTWEGQDGIVVICNEKEPLLKNSLRQSSAFTFNDLVLLADHYNHERPRNATRNELLKFLADAVSDGNEDYISLVLNSDAKCSHKKQMNTMKNLKSKSSFLNQFWTTWMRLRRINLREWAPRWRPERSWRRFLTGRSYTKRNALKRKQLSLAW